MGAGAASPAPDILNTKSLPGAVPASSAGGLPTSQAQYHALTSEIAKARPKVDEAKRRSDSLNSQAQELKRRLVDTAARVQGLESEKVALDATIARLTKREAGLTTDFSRQRAQVIALLAILERMQHDVPPVMAIRAGDALAAAHSSMLLGAALQQLYRATAGLSFQLDALQRTRAELVRRRVDAARNAAVLASARAELDQLLAMKSKEAEEAGIRYDDLAAKLGTASEQAADLGALLQRVEALRATPSQQSAVIVVQSVTNAGMRSPEFLRPVIGRVELGDGAPAGSARAPGVSFLTLPAAEVIAPADSQVLFAGPYHKTGQVLILQTAAGYDLVLAGLESIDVRAGNQLLAGEPVGRMPRNGAEARLYFELRRNGRGVNPGPWLEHGSGKAKKS